MIIGSFCHYLHINGLVCASTCPLPLGANTWLEAFLIFFGKVVSVSFDSKHVRATSITNIDFWDLFDTLFPEKLAFPPKMNVDLKFVFRSIVQVIPDRYIKDISIFTHTFLSSDDFVHHHDGVLYKFRYCKISGEKGES